MNKEKNFGSLHRRLFFLLLVILPTQLGYHFWPKWAMVLGRKIDYLSPTIYLTDILVVLILTSWTAESLTSRRRKITNKNTLRYRLFPQLLVVVLVIFFTTANIYVAASPLVALYTWAKVLEYVLLGWYVVRTKPTLTAIATPLSIAILCSSALAIVQFFLQRSVGGPLWWLGERTFSVDTPGIARTSLCNFFTRGGCREALRPYGTFPHPNVLGGFLAVAIPLVLTEFIRQMNQSDTLVRQWWKKQNVRSWLYGTAVIFGFVALGLTFSRSAWVVGAVAIALAISGMKNHEAGIRNKKITIFYSLFILLLLMGLVKVNLQEESVVVRNQLNAAALTIWRQSPLIGVGLGNFLVNLPKALPFRSVYFLQPAHNIYLLVLTETGLVGLAIFLWVLWLASKSLVSSILYHVSRKSRISPDVYHVSLVSLLLLGLVDHYPLTLQQGQLLLTLLIGMSLVREK